MRGRAATIVAGAALIAVLVPLVQFVSIGMLNADLETAAPCGWAVGLVASIALAGAALRLVARGFRLPTQQVVVLYAMLAIAVPLMNIGFVRPLVLTLRAVQHHFVGLAQNTYRTAYEAETPAWFPVVPTAGGLAWNKAQRLLDRLTDRDVQAGRSRARRDFLLLLGGAAAPADAVGLLARLGVDELESLPAALARDPAASNAFARSRLEPLAAQMLADGRAASAAAAARLTTALAAFDEHEAYRVPAAAGQLDRSTRQRVQEDDRRLGDAERADLDARTARLSGSWQALRRDVSALSSTDAARVRDARAALYLDAWRGLPPARLAALRASFVFRSSGPERAALYAQDGLDRTPRQSLHGFSAGLDVAAPDPAARASCLARVRRAAAAVPWRVWLPPLAHWTALCTCLFLFLMCLAETLRRKWVDRENLAFPLVEVADYLIRRDFALEAAGAGDPSAPAPRGRLLSPLFGAGAAAGALVVAVEALGHYRVLPDVHLLAFDISTKLFTSGALRELDRIVFVLSPVAVGVLFLVSLEISFSVWVIFLLYSVAFFVGRQACGEIKDSVFSGWAGGRFYPFAMEQLLGAAVCFALILVWKARPRRGEDPAATPGYVPRRWLRAGLVVLPLAVIGLLWHMGVRNVPFVLLTGGIVLALAVAAARLRAESGLPAQHVTYEFTKFPMVFGLTGWTGSRVYTLFVSLAVLPVTLLFRTLAQQLENLELARRHRVDYRTVAAATLTAFLVAVPVGLVSFLVLAYGRGSAVYAGPQQPNFEGIMHYPLWVSHFLGEHGLDQMRQAHGIRVAYVALGAAVFGGLTLLRGRLMGFPLHPLGYLLVLSSVYFEWVSPYYKGHATLETRDASWLWGSALLAWTVKKLIVKYGGMNGYRRAKPFFVGLAVGALVGLFAAGALHLAALLAAGGSGAAAGPLLKTFTDAPAFNPAVY